MSDEAEPSSDFLDQSEVDRLLAPAAEPPGGRPALLRADGGRGDAAAALKVEPFDFRHPAFLSEGELRRLRSMHEDFIRYLSARLSLHLRMELGLTLAKLTTVTYAKFTAALPSPTHLSLFKVEPLIGVGMLNVNPRLALAIADRLLGGRGRSIKAERHLTEIEVALLEDVLVILLEEWGGQWKPEQELRPTLIGHENNGRFLQTSPKDAVVLALTLEASFGDCSEQIQLGVPYYMIEPLVKQTQARRQKHAAGAVADKRAAWQPAYDRIAMPVRAEWAAFELSLREIVSLRVGDIIEMPATICSETQVLLNGTAKFTGTVGLDTDRVAVQLTRKIPAEETLHAHPDGRKVL